MLLTLCRNLVMHRDSFILVKHITETRRRRLSLFFRENYHGFPFFLFSPRKPFLMIYKILFCRLSFNLSNGGDVFGDWNHRLENWMVLISNLFRCWSFSFDCVYHLSPPGALVVMLSFRRTSFLSQTPQTVSV